MTTIYLISDSHFGHANILNFTTQYGVPMRTRPSTNAKYPPYNFNSVEEMDEYMIEKWNEVVRPQDKIYHLGDLAVKRNGGLDFMSRLNGQKRLVRGNHDKFKTSEYMKYFDEIYGVLVGHLEGFILSHIPVHPRSLRDRFVNLHGHIHNNESPTSFTPSLGPQYFNVSCEVLKYRPISIDEIRNQIKAWAE
jgi:calcineurin-like phosphoesterase family protein